MNHETTQILDDIFTQLDIECQDDEISEPPGLYRWPGATGAGIRAAFDRLETGKTASKFRSGIHLTSSLDILQDIGPGKGPEDYLVILGFSGWASGQLESELQQNSWLTSSCDANLLFHQKPEDKWQVAFDSLGFDISMLSPVSGNA